MPLPIGWGEQGWGELGWGSETNITVYLSGWGADTVGWGEQGWGETYYRFTGTGEVGTVSVAASTDISVTGLAAR